MDLSRLAERLGLDEGEFLELAELFVETSLSDLGKLTTAIEQECAEDVFKSAHSIKGASGNMGFTEIFELAKGVEMNARDDSLDGAAEVAVTIRERIDELADYLDEKSKIS